MIRAAVLLCAFACPAFAGGPVITDPWARVTALSGAVYLMLDSAEADTLLKAETPAAARSLIHQTVEAEGVTSMRPLEQGLPLSPGITELAPGGTHIMLMGLTAPLADGQSFSLTLTFALAPPQTIEVTVDNSRALAAE
jgi:copper(I)-binding protein